MFGQTKTEIRPYGNLPVTVQVPRSPRLEKLAAEANEAAAKKRDLEKTRDELLAEGQKLDQAGVFSPETSSRRELLRGEIDTVEKQIAVQEFRLVESLDQHGQWKTQIAGKIWRRGELWREYGRSLPGPPSDSLANKVFRTHSVGEAPQRSKGDVRQDLIATLQWLLAFAGHDQQMVEELRRLQTEKLEESS